MDIQKSITDELIEWLNSIAGDVRENFSYVHWLGERTGIVDPDQSNLYCAECCEKEAARLDIKVPGSEHFCDGGSGSEEDGFQYCATCSAQLECGITDYGAHRTAEEFIAGEFSLDHGPTRRETAADLVQVADRLDCSYDKDAKVQSFFAALMAARMNEIIAPFVQPQSEDAGPAKRSRRLGI